MARSDSSHTNSSPSSAGLFTVQSSHYRNYQVPHKGREERRHQKHSVKEYIAWSTEKLTVKMMLLRRHKWDTYVQFPKWHSCHTFLIMSYRIYSSHPETLKHRSAEHIWACSLLSPLSKGPCLNLTPHVSWLQGRGSRSFSIPVSQIRMVLTWSRYLKIWASSRWNSPNTKNCK